jgi:rubredoxin
MRVPFHIISILLLDLRWNFGLQAKGDASRDPLASVLEPEDEVWKCSVCGHVYDAAKDGGGAAFEDLPSTWVCPVCGAPKSAYAKQSIAGGEVVWSHTEPASAAASAADDEVWKCSVCGHVYDAAKDGGGAAFEDLPSTWVCPVCGAPKSAYAKQSLPTQPIDEVWKCQVCGHVYNPAVDGGPNHLAFEDLPSTWMCPVCGAPKSSYAKQVVATGRTLWVHV